MMVPWDIYLPTPNAVRYYGNASQFADLYALVRNNVRLFDNMQDAGTAGPACGHVWAGTNHYTPWARGPLSQCVCVCAC